MRIDCLDNLQCTQSVGVFLAVVEKGKTGS